jgi:hypothetical protein
MATRDCRHAIVNARHLKCAPIRPCVVLPVLPERGRYLAHWHGEATRAASSSRTPPSRPRARLVAVRRRVHIHGEPSGVPGAFFYTSFRSTSRLTQFSIAALGKLYPPNSTNKSRTDCSTLWSNGRCRCIQRKFDERRHFIILSDPIGANCSERIGPRLKFSPLQLFPAEGEA